MLPTRQQVPPSRHGRSASSAIVPQLLTLLLVHVNITRRALHIVCLAQRRVRVQILDAPNEAVAHLHTVPLLVRVSHTRGTIEKTHNLDNVWVATAATVTAHGSVTRTRLRRGPT